LAVIVIAAATTAASAAAAAAEEAAAVAVVVLVVVMRVVAIVAAFPSPNVIYMAANMYTTGLRRNKSSALSLSEKIRTLETRCHR
jgi:hypothetical protein